MGISFRQLENLPDEDTFFNLVTQRNRPETGELLRKSTVGIAGIGGLGSNIAVHLARAGVGHLILADYDVVDPSNMNRQHYFLKHIGLKKSEAIKDVIKQINPFIKVTSHDTYLEPSSVEELFKEVDVMVEAFDNANNKQMLLSSWLKIASHKPLVTASGMAGIGPSNSIRTRKLGRQVYLIGDLQTEATASEGLFASRVAIAAAHQSHTVIRLLLGEEEI